VVLTAQGAALSAELPRTRKQELLAEEVRAAVAALPPPPAEMDTQRRFTWLIEVQRCLHRAGLVTVAWPETLGGRGLGAEDAAVVADELGRCHAPELANFVAVDIVAPALMRFADEVLLSRWLPPMAAAEEIWCQLFSEPDAGSDLASLRTVARRDGNQWRVRGQKVWSSWAQFARFGLLLARSGSTEQRHRGITAFVLDMTAPGVSVRPLRTMTGGEEFCEVFLDDAPVPDENRVGAVDRGWDVALLMLAQERGPYAVRRASVIRSALQDLIEAARTQRLRPHQRMAVVDAVLAMRILDVRITDVVRALAAGEDLGERAALTKMLLTDAEQRVFAAAQELLGPRGIAWRDDAVGGVVEAFLYSRAASIYGGTSDIQRSIIAERLLGLPRR
jgi:alkylation response protein AidB-like acyl-CoA dehydrogenase